MGKLCGRNLPINLSGSNVNIQEGQGRASSGRSGRKPSALRDVRQTAARPRALQTIFLSDCTQGWREWRAGSQTSAVAPNYCDCSLLPTHRPSRESDKTMINRNHYLSFQDTHPAHPTLLQVRGTALCALLRLRQSVSKPDIQSVSWESSAVATYQLIFLGAT